MVVRVYQFLGLEGTASVLTTEDNANTWHADGRHIFTFKESHRVADAWTPPKVEVLLHKDGKKNGKKLRLDDIRAAFAGDLIATPKAKEALEAEFGEYLEFLPLDCATEELWVMHVLPAVQAIDHARSCPRYADYDMHDVPFKPIGPRVGTDPPYAFYEESIKDLPVFRDVDASRGYFMTDRFVDFIQDSGLTGFDPRLRYDSEVNAKGFDDMGRPLL